MVRRISSDSVRPLSIVLREPLGRELRRILPASDRVIMNRLGLATGTYLVEVMWNDRREARRLIVDQR